MMINQASHSYSAGPRFGLSPKSTAWPAENPTTEQAGAPQQAPGNVGQTQAPKITDIEAKLGNFIETLGQRLQKFFHRMVKAIGKLLHGESHQRSEKERFKQNLEHLAQSPTVDQQVQQTLQTIQEILLSNSGLPEEEQAALRQQFEEGASPKAKRELLQNMLGIPTTAVLAQINDALEQNPDLMKGLMNQQLQAYQALIAAMQGLTTENVFAATDTHAAKSPDYDE